MDIREQLSDLVNTETQGTGWGDTVARKILKNYHVIPKLSAKVEEVTKCSGCGFDYDCGYSCNHYGKKMINTDGYYTDKKPENCKVKRILIVEE